ncbi:MAG TPA: hypothetical protein VE398_18760 [Acidobacteriota bacterium]|nr:hypothetical protein [Acidobacteriota bacterium]
MMRPMEIIHSLLLGSNGPNIPDIFESRIAGSFDGWSGETVFKLRNGQVWQQSSEAVTRHSADMPGVLIYRSGIGYKMKVDGIDQTISVKRVR